MDWIKVSERLPNLPGDYLTYSSGGDILIASFDHATKKFSALNVSEEDVIIPVMFWMPLPDPPQK